MTNYHIKFKTREEYSVAYDKLISMFSSTDETAIKSKKQLFDVITLKNQWDKVKVLQADGDYVYGFLLKDFCDFNSKELFIDKIECWND